MNRAKRRREHQPLMLALESRRLLAQVLAINDWDGDIFSAVLTGPGTLTPTLGPGFGLRFLIANNTTIGSSLTITRVAQESGADGELDVNLINAPDGDIGSISLGNFVRLTPEPGVGSTQGVAVVARLRTLTVEYEIVGADILSGGDGPVNRTRINVGRAGGLTGDPVRVIHDGYIEEATFGELVGAQFTVGRMGSLRVTSGGSTDFDLSTTDASAPFGVKTIDIAGTLTEGSWNIVAPVQSIRLGSVTGASGGGFTFAAQIAVRLGTLCTTVGELHGNWTVVNAGTIKSAGDLTGKFVAVGGGTIDSLRGRRFLSNDGFVDAQAGRIKQVHLQSMFGATIFAGRVDSLTLTGGPGDPGNMQGGGMSVTGASGTTLGTMTVAGDLVNTTVIVNANVGDVRVRGMTQSDFLVGLASPNAQTLVNNANAFTGGNTGFVKSFRMDAAPGDPINFVDSYVTALRFGSLRSTTNINTGNGGTQFGISFVQLDTSTSIRIPTLGTVTGTNPANEAVGDFRLLNL